MPSRLHATFLLAAALLVGCGEHATTAAPAQPRIENGAILFPPASPQLNAISVAPVVDSSATIVTVPGRLVWNEDHTVRLFPAFAGRVVGIDAKVGDSVTNGQPLAHLVSPDFGAAQADVRKAQAEASLAQQALARVRLLTTNEVAPLKDLQAAESESTRAEAELARARERLKIYGNGKRLDGGYTLSAPIAGIVVERNINPGQELRPDMSAGGAAPMFVITDPSRLWLVLDATERDLPNLAKGRRIAFRANAWPGEVFEGRVEMVSDFVDPQSRTIKVRGSVDNQDRRLKGEMFVTAQMEAPSTGGATVPGKAVFLLGDRHYVFVEESAGRFRQVEVFTGNETADQITVTRGLVAGQRVVVAGSLFLQQILRTRR